MVNTNVQSKRIFDRDYYRDLQNKDFLFFKEISHKSYNALQGYDIEHNDISEVDESHFSEQTDGVATTELNMPMEKC